MFCTSCGARIEDGAKFCPKCGAAQAIAEPAVTVQMPAATAGSEPVQPTVAAPPVATTASPEAPSEVPAQTPVNTAPQKGASRGLKIAIVILVVLVLAGGGAAGYYFGVYKPEQERIEADRIAHVDHKAIVSVAAEDWDTTSGASRLPVHITGEDLDGNAIDEVQYVDSAGEGIVLKQGTYTLAIAASPIAADGTIFTVGDDKIEMTVGNLSEGVKADLTKSGTLSLAPADPASVTDDQINAAYDYASKDAGEGAPDADALKQAAVTKRDEAVAAKKAEEAKQARTVQAASYEFLIPEQWVGRVDVQVDGNSVKIVSKQYPRLTVCTLSYHSDDSNEVRGDYIDSWAGESDAFNGAGAHVEIWARRWGLFIAELAAKNSKDPADYYSADEAQEIVDLQSGGAYTYEQVRKSYDKESHNTSSDFDLTGFIADSIVPTITAK